MKKLYTQGFCMLFLMVTATSFSQLFVGTGGSVFVNDRMVFVTQDVNLDPNGNVYLRNESQLLQELPAVLQIKVPENYPFSRKEP